MRWTKVALYSVVAPAYVVKIQLKMIQEASAVKMTGKLNANKRQAQVTLSCLR